MAFLLSRHGEHGDVFAVELDGVPTVVFGGADGPGVLFRAERDHLVVHNTLLVRELFGRAVFNLSGEQHRRARRPLRLAMTGQALRDLTPAIKALAADHVRGWSDRGVVDLRETARVLTLDVCSWLILGLSPGSDDAREFPGLFAAFVAAADSGSDSHVTDAVCRRGMVAAAELRAMIGRRVAAAAEMPKADVVSHLVAGTDVLADIGDHLLAMMIAARETTASLLAWMLIELAQAPHAMQQAAAAEIHASADAMPAMIQVALWETERLHSPNILSLRRVVADLSTPIGVVPAGWHAAYSPAANHLLPGLFDDPWHFRAARFDGESGVRRAAGLLTFGQGTHACPGKPFAELLVGSVAATALGGHRLALIDPPPTHMRCLSAKTPIGPVRGLLRRQGGRM